MKNIFEFYEEASVENIKRVICRYKIGNDCYNMTNDYHDIDEKLKSVNQVLKMLNGDKDDIKYKLNILKKNDAFVNNHKKEKMNLPNDFELDTYLNNIQKGSGNTKNILLNYVSDNVDIIIEPTSFFLQYFDILDLSNEYVSEKVAPVKEFLNENKKEKYINLKERDNIKKHFKKNPGKVKAKSTNKSGVLVAIGALGLMIFTNGVLNSMDVMDEYNKNIKEHKKAMFYNGQVINENVIYKDSSSADIKEKDISNIPSLAPKTVETKEEISEGYTNITLDTLESDSYKNELYNEVYAKYASIIEPISISYGIDSKLLAAIITQESAGIGSKDFNDGGAIGLCQIQNTNLGTELTAYNYVTEQVEKITLDKDTLQNDVAFVVRCVAIRAQNLLDQFDGNIIMALQAYNYGPTKISNMIEQYSNERIYPNGNTAWFKSFDEIISDQNDLGWLDLREDNYGDSKYVEHVLAPFGEENIHLTCKYNKGQLSKVNISSSLVKDNSKKH